VHETERNRKKRKDIWLSDFGSQPASSVRPRLPCGKDIRKRRVSHIDIHTFYIPYYPGYMKANLKTGCIFTT
jgi:hypothetical protein